MGLVTTRRGENSPLNCSAIVHYRSRLWVLLYQREDGLVMLVICSSGSRHASLKAGRQKPTARICLESVTTLGLCS